MNRPLQEADCRLDAALLRRGVTLRSQGGFLYLEAPIAADPPFENLLRENTTPRHRWRSVLGTGDLPMLRAELMFGEDDSCAFDEARDALLNDTATSANGAAHLANETLGQLCGDAGWDFFARTGGGGSVLLPGTPPEGSVATLASNRAGLLVSVDFEILETPVPVTLRATGRLLLRAASMVRFARPLMLPGDDGAFTPRLEILLLHAPTAVLLGEALGALTLAAQLCSAECAALGNETIAREFLARLEDRGALKPPTRNQPEKHTT